MTQVPEATVRQVVGPLAVEDCKRALDLGWYSCSTLADRCTQLVLMANGRAILQFDPSDCTTELPVGQWLLGSPKTHHHSVIPVRGPDQPEPQITPRP